MNYRDMPIYSRIGNPAKRMILSAVDHFQVDAYQQIEEIVRRVVREEIQAALELRKPQ